MLRSDKTEALGFETINGSRLALSNLILISISLRVGSTSARGASVGKFSPGNSKYIFLSRISTRNSVDLRRGNLGQLTVRVAIEMSQS